ncbi:unnamed protein product, partial [Musa acuminata var. zebrina]
GSEGLLPSEHHCLLGCSYHRHLGFTCAPTLLHQGQVPPPCRYRTQEVRLISPSTSTGDDGRRSRVTCRAKKTVDEVLVVVDANWENLVAASDKPVLVEFWAPWCGPCRMIAPVIKELARDYAGKIVCCQVNTDDCPGIASRFGIRSIPTVLVFKNGEKKESVIGAVPKSTLVSVVDKYLEGS